MSNPFYSSKSLGMDRQNQVERLVIPFTVTHNATPGSVILNNDERDIMYLQTQGVNQIIAHDPLAASQFANQSLSDSGGGSGPALGAASTFGALSATPSLSNTGGTVVTGDIGVSPAASIIGFPPGTFSGTQHIADGTASAAQTALAAAIVTAQGLTPTATLTGQVLGTGGTVPTLTPGVYFFASTAQLTGALTLNGAGAYTFQVSSSLTTASGSSVILTGGATAANVTWVMGASATIGTGATMIGNLLAHTSVTLTTGASLQGRALANTGQVTLDTNAITVPTSGGPSGQLNILVDVAPGRGGKLMQASMIDRVSGVSYPVHLDLGGLSGEVSGPIGPVVNINATTLTSGQVYVITSLGTTPPGVWNELGLASYVLPAVGVKFIANAFAFNSLFGSGQVRSASPSGISSDGKLMMFVTTSVDFSSTDLNAALMVEYKVADQGGQ
jgi:hypothetical protein